MEIKIRGGPTFIVKDLKTRMMSTASETLENAVIENAKNDPDFRGFQKLMIQLYAEAKDDKERLELLTEYLELAFWQYENMPMVRESMTAEDLLTRFAKDYESTPYSVEYDGARYVKGELGYSKAWTGNCMYVPLIVDDEFDLLD